MAKILVVDDNRDHAESLAAILAGAGYEVIKETRAKEVFKVAKAQKPDMVMLDVNMPELNGLEAARILKSNKETKDLLVLIHSATDKAGAMFQQALEAGAEDFIKMPADKEEIVSRVAVCLRRAKDISDRKREVEELRLRAEIMKNVAEGIYLIRLDDGIIVYANQKFEKMFGYNPGEMIGKEVSVVNAPTDKTPAERKDEIMDVLVKTGEWHGEVRNIKKDGTPFWCSANVSLADHPDYGRVIVSVHSDITEKKRTEEEAKRGAEQWQKTFDSINDLVFIQDKDYTITRVNQSFAAALKAKPEDLIGKKCYQVLHKLDKPWPECPFTETRKDNQVHNAEIIDPKIGIPLLVTISPIFNDKGELTGSVHIAKDISVMKKAEKELKKKIRDLERFQKVMMNREKRVIELKAEVKELKRRLGEG